MQSNHEYVLNFLLANTTPVHEDGDKRTYEFRVPSFVIVVQATKVDGGYDILDMMLRGLSASEQCTIS